MIALDEFMPPLALFFIIVEGVFACLLLTLTLTQAPKRSLGGGLAYMEREWRGNSTLGLVSILGGLASFCLGGLRG